MCRTLVGDIAPTSTPHDDARGTLTAMTDPPVPTRSPAVRISCVCLGNICRSPMAAAIVADHATAAGLTVVVESAGTSGWHVGGPAHPGTRAELARHGIASDHVARRFARDDLDRLDLVLAMDRANRTSLLALADTPEAAGKIVLVRAFDPESPPGAEVPDPYGGGPDAFREVFRMLDAAAAGLVTHLHGATWPPQPGARVPA
jgi:protein-tyrosine phosphatase